MATLVTKVAVANRGLLAAAPLQWTTLALQALPVALAFPV